MKNPHKEVITTFSDKLASFLGERGARVIVLYQADGIRCYRVTLRGREQLRTLTSAEYVSIAAGTMLDGYRLAAARSQPPVYVVTSGDEVAITKHTDETTCLLLGRQAEMLAAAVTPPGEVLPEGLGTRSILTWEALKAVLDGAAETGVDRVRFYIGYGYNNKLPYQETYELRLLQDLVNSRLSLSAAHEATADSRHP